MGAKIEVNVQMWQCADVQIGIKYHACREKSEIVAKC
jgi:hypothetical protein